MTRTFLVGSRFPILNASFAPVFNSAGDFVR